LFSAYWLSAFNPRASLRNIVAVLCPTGGTDSAKAVQIYSWYFTFFSPICQPWRGCYRRQISAPIFSV